MKIIYQAEDGKQFDSEEDCLLYEKNLPKSKLAIKISNDLRCNQSCFEIVENFLKWVYFNQNLIEQFYSFEEVSLETRLQSYFPRIKYKTSVNDILEILLNEKELIKNYFRKQNSE